MSEETLFNTVSIPAMFGGAYVHACRVCGSLVPIEPIEYADRHVAWHAEAEARR